MYINTLHEHMFAYKYNSLKLEKCNCDAKMLVLNITGNYCWMRETVIPMADTNNQ